MSLRVTGHDLPSASLPAKLATNGLPMSGKIDLSLDFDLPKEKNKAGVVASDWSKAEGSLEIECPSGCNFGDGKSKWKPIVKNRSQQAMVSDGLEIESLEVAKLDAKLDIKEGHAKLTKLDVQSNDGEVHLDFDLKLAATLDESIVTGCVRFKTADGLFKRKPKADGAIRNTGAELRSDGYFHIKLADTWRDMKRLNAECGPNAKPDEHDAPGTGMMGGGVVRPAARPNLTVQPDEATHVRPGIPATPPQPIEPPGDAGAAPTPPPSAPSNGHLPGSEVEAPPAGSAGSAGAEGTGAASGGGPPNQVLQKR
jgi:hypothetical protein